MSEIPKKTPLLAETDAKPVLVIETEREGLVLKELSSGEDDRVYLEALQEDPQHVDNYLNRVASIYDTLEKVTERRHTAGDDIRMGIWDGDRLVGGISFRVSEEDKSQAELGYWLRKSAVGHGYATLATKALTHYVSPRFDKIFAEVHPDNIASQKVLERSGYHQSGVVERDWSGVKVAALVFDAK
jgi:RimJ/RimL family protein N-acetyltransferase